jgi:sugar-specific transcriptional regulator TrmB
MGGMSMREIQKMTDISKTKVYDILHEAESYGKKIFLCHNLTSNLNKNGITAREYAELYRTKNILMRQRIQPAKVHETIREIIDLCFIVGLEPHGLVTCFDNFRQLIRSYPEDLDTLKSDLENMQSVSNELDVVMKNCKNLRLAIDMKERSGNSSKNYTSKKANVGVS